MAGTKIGGMKARDANIRRDPDHYRKIGRMGGLVKGKFGGFASGKVCECSLIEDSHPYARCAGKRGAMIRWNKPVTK